MPKTQYLAAYDITDDDLRKAIADLLKNNGLERIQYSVFYGNLTRNEAEEIGIKFKEITLGHKAQLLLMSICESCAKKQLVITNEGDCPHNDTEKKEEQQDNENKNKPRQNEKNKEKQENLENDEGKESQKKQTKNKKQEKTEKQPKTRSKKKKPTTIPLDELKEQKKQRIIFF